MLPKQTATMLRGAYRRIQYFAEACSEHQGLKMQFFRGIWSILFEIKQFSASEANVAIGYWSHSRIVREVICQDKCIECMRSRTPAAFARLHIQKNTCRLSRLPWIILMGGLSSQKSNDIDASVSQRQGLSFVEVTEFLMLSRTVSFVWTCFG